MATTRKPAAGTGKTSAGTARSSPKASGKAAGKPAATAAADRPATAAAPATTRKPPRTKSPAGTRAGREISADQRAHYVEVAAYYIAERRGFAPGDPLADWLAAEDKIDRLIAEGKLG